MENCGKLDNVFAGRKKKIQVSIIGGDKNGRKKETIIKALYYS